MIGKVDECMFFYEALFPSYVILISWIYCKSGGEVYICRYIMHKCACLGDMPFGLLGVNRLIQCGGDSS